MHILIRTDASVQIGTGHVMRCLALAQAWRDGGGSAAFASAELPAPLSERLAREEIDVVRIKELPGSAADAAATLAAAESRGANWIVLDGYVFGGAYQERLKASGRQLLVIDDFRQIGQYGADLILDQNLGAQPSDYQNRPATTRLLLGPRYALLRREFRHRTVATPTAEQGQKVLVTLGGSDPHNVTAKVLGALAQVSAPGLTVKAILGVANPHGDALTQLRGRMPYSLEMISSTDDMPALMAWADLAITAGGSTCWELCCLGVPHLVLILADNQQRIASGLAEQAQQVNLGWHDQCTETAIARAVDDVMRDFPRRRTMAEKIQTLVDGQGAERVVKAIHALREHADANSATWQ